MKFVLNIYCRICRLLYSQIVIRRTEVVLENPGVADSKPLVIGTIDPKQGGNYVYLVKQDGNNYTITQHTITEPNSIHIMWMVPQFVVITLGEVMFSVTGLQFSFSQVSLKHSRKVELPIMYDTRGTNTCFCVGSRKHEVRCPSGVAVDSGIWKCDSGLPSRIQTFPRTGKLIFLHRKSSCVLRMNNIAIIFLYFLVERVFLVCWSDVR